MSSSSGDRRRQDELSDQLGDRSGFGAAACHPPNSPGGMREWNVAPPSRPFSRDEGGRPQGAPVHSFLQGVHAARCNRDLVRRFTGDRASGAVRTRIGDPIVCAAWDRHCAASRSRVVRHRSAGSGKKDSDDSWRWLSQRALPSCGSRYQGYRRVLKSQNPG